MRDSLILCLLALLLVACGRPLTTDNPAASATPTPAGIGDRPDNPPPAGTAAPSATPADTPTPTQTATPTPTPTATALPLTVFTIPPAGTPAPPIPQGHAPCGVVDVLDFPMNPPDADNVSGGRDFGVFRSRFDKFHAGEDWWGSGRGSTFGEPVYSIGHGLVTYAEPEGWNRDKGVIIIQHILRDGSQVLSFYGHLDPPSVLLEPGRCVVRGQQIGQVGRPRGSPHLHFEIRTQSPYAPLTGYWPEDPTLVGWLPPSQFIWQQRLLAAPGMQWVRPFAGGDARLLGLLNDEIAILLEAGQLRAIQLADGRERWRYTIPEAEILSAALDATRPLLYLSSSAGHIVALTLTDGQGLLTVPQPLWELEWETLPVGPQLLPLPGEGVAIAEREQFTVLDADGRTRWRETGVGLPLAWASAGDTTYLATSGGAAALWQLEATGLQPWDAPAGGHPLAAGDRLWLYTRDALYRLDPATRTATLHYALPAGSLSLGDATALPDGSFMLAHADRYDRRLLHFAPDGSLLWERSYGGQLSGTVHFVLLDGDIYLLLQDTANGSLTLYTLDRLQGTLSPIFRGGSRTLAPQESWAQAVGDQLLLYIGGGPTLRLDVQQTQTLNHD